MFRKVFIANRGEIALRILRTLKRLGLQVVVPYTAAERDALPVQLADEAVELSGESLSQTYLNSKRLVEIASKYGCDAIHPGYGFLSENPSFARACREAGMAFIGPRTEAMVLAGDKFAAKKEAERAGIPVIPYMKVTQKKKVLSEIGFPLMVKAAFGGGGKGMRLVPRKEDLMDALEAARREAKSAFHDDTLYLEKVIAPARHIEVQLIADEKGQIICLGERECSLQRRHQKIVEESPSPFVDDQLRLKLFEATKALARAIGYTNAGTVEYLVDREKNFYFLELNARLQVEHPVTELRTGLDLVQLQVEVAAGMPLSFAQEQIQTRGHAIEARLYAEDPENGFLPSAGQIIELALAHLPFARVDTALRVGEKVDPVYDPLLMKLLGWGRDRKTATENLLQALQETRLLGVQTNRDFLIELLRDDRFRQGETYTSTVEELSRERQKVPLELIALAGAMALLEGQRKKESPREKSQHMIWEHLGRFRLFS